MGIAPWQVRCTAIALGYNVTLGVVGGLSPLVATWLVARTANNYSPAFMIMAAAAVFPRDPDIQRDVQDTAAGRLGCSERFAHIGRPSSSTASEVKTRVGDLDAIALALAEDDSKDIAAAH